MPGIFGFRLRGPGRDAGRIAARFARDLELFDWQESSVCPTGDSAVYLGVAWNDLEPSARGASHHAAGDITCVLEGSITRTLEDCGAADALAASRHAEAAVLAYRKFGSEFATRLEGPFSLVLHDGRDGSLFGITERHGLMPLYRHDGPDSVCFSSLLGPMARGDLFPARIAPAAAATHLGHHHLFYRQALLEDVVLQDPATVAVARPGDAACEVRKFWHYGFEGPRDDSTYAERIDAVCDTLIAATDRLLALPGRPGASLSGGLDSRLMVGLAHRQGAVLEPWTMGGDGAGDVTVAGEICNRLAWQHHVVVPDPETIPEYADVYATILNGSGPLQNAYTVPRCDQFRGTVDRMFNGYRGGVVLGKAIVDLGIQPRLRWWRSRLGLGPRVVSPNLEDARDPRSMAAFYRALSHAAAPRVAEWTAVPEPSLADMFTDALAGPLSATPPDYQIEQWTEEFGGGRHFTLCSIFADRHFYSDSSVFYDYDVRDRCFALDPADRRGNKAYVAVLERLLPDLARVTYANTGLPANVSGTPLMLARMARRLTAGRTSASTGFSAGSWLRLPRVRDFAGDIVHSASFRSRPWWRGDMIVADFDAYQAGADGLVNELWDAVTLELFARRWLDQPAEDTA